MNDKINQLIYDSKLAQKNLLIKNDNEINKIIVLIVKHIFKSNINEKISKMAVHETGFGNVKDKIEKNKNKTLNLLNEILNIKTFEPYKLSKKKIIKILKPIGVICGSTPSTNPIATTLNYVINSIKCKNSIIICPNIRTFNTVSFLINEIRSKLIENKVDPNVVSIVPKSVLRDDSLIDLFNLTDKNIITGNRHIINKVKKSTKPFLVFGTGNAIILIEKSANTLLAARSIADSKSFDNSTSCSSDSVIIVEKAVYEVVLKKLKNVGFYILNAEEKKKIDKIFFIKGMVNPKILAKTASQILKEININSKNTKVIAYEIDSKNLSHYIFSEKLLPICGLVKAKDLNSSLDLTNKILENSGKGHSCGIFSNNKNAILETARKVNVSRLIVNQPHSRSAGGGQNNDLNTTLSLGCGVWGESNIDHNLFYEDFCNKTLVANKKSNKYLTFKEIFTKYG